MSTVVLSFIGKLPPYIVDSLRQILLFHQGPIYLICNDVKSEYISTFPANIQIIPYVKVISYEILDVVQKHKDKFCIVHRLKGRESLFIRSFERFFLLRNLMKKNNIENVIFLEVDVLIYDNPDSWVEIIQKNTTFHLCYTFANEKLCCGGLTYVKAFADLDPFLQYCLDFISTTSDFVSEMTAMYEFSQLHPKIVGILPTIHEYEEKSVNPCLSFQNQNVFSDSVFDAMGMGIYLFGVDPCHTEGKVQKGLNMFSHIDFTRFDFEWRADEHERKIPYVSMDQRKTWLRVNNLHIHSKTLSAAVSKS